LISSGIDITDRKRASADLQNSEERFRSLVEATAAIVWSTGPSGEFEDTQHAWTYFTGQSIYNVRGWGWLNAVHPDDRSRTADLWLKALNSRVVFRIEHRLKRRHGLYRWMQARAVPVLNPERSILNAWEFTQIFKGSGTSRSTGGNES
jgi:PAS domain S-box-containing protein